MYVDSGYVEYLTRGTFLLVILIFAGLFLFLRNNLKSKNAAYSLFFIFLLFENGSQVLLIIGLFICYHLLFYTLTIYMTCIQIRDYVRIKKDIQKIRITL